MTIRSLARRLALSAPPMRRFYDFAITASARADEAEQLNRQLEQVNRQLAADLNAITQTREASELQLYVLRSDVQRAAERNDQLLNHIRELSEELEAVRGHHKEAIDRQQETQGRLEQVMANLSAAVAEAGQLRSALEVARHMQQPHPTPQDFELLSARIAAQITVFSQDMSNQVKRALAAAGPGTSNRGDAGLYLDLLEKVLTGEIVQDPAISPWSDGFDPQVRLLGRDWPKTALTMIGTARMRNLRMLAERVIDDGVPGDFLEAGVWRGGACIFMRGILAAHGVGDRRVWVADSFAGLPPPDPEAYPADKGDEHHTVKELAISQEDVAASFARFDLLDDQVRFLKGWFADTLPSAPIEKLSILRLDGDMYSSTIQTLDALYHKVSPGGFIIVDDYILDACRQAVTDFRERHGIDETIHNIDGAGAYWRKRTDADTLHV